MRWDIVSLAALTAAGIAVCVAGVGLVRKVIGSTIPGLL